MRQRSSERLRELVSLAFWPCGTVRDEVAHLTTIETDASTFFGGQPCATQLYRSLLRRTIKHGRIGKTLHAEVKRVGTAETAE